MGKWLVVAGIALVAVLILLWREMTPSEATPNVPVKAAKPAPAEAIASAAPIAPVAPAAAPAVDDGKPKKLDTRSDEFFYKFDEMVPKNLTRNAAKCYEGRHGSLQRNQHLTLMYKINIVNGQVQIHDIKIKEDSLNDPALTACFIQQVANSTWKDDELPDWEQDDQLKLSPERGMKKYWQDNIDYVGPEAPKQ